MRTIIVIAVLLIATGVVAGSNEWDGRQTIYSVPYTYTPQDTQILANVAIFRDQLPWGYSTDDDILIANSIAFVVFGSADIGSVDLTLFDKVVISNQQSSAFNDIVIANASWLEQYVQSGGLVLLGLAHYSGDLTEGLLLPGGFTFLGSGCYDLVAIDDPGHKVFAEPNIISTAELQGWGCSTHGELNIPAGATTMIVNAEFITGPALSEVKLGDGWIIATTQPYQYGGASYNFAENLLLYLPSGSVATEQKSFGTVKSMFR